MIEWSETELLIRDSIREFIGKEVRPHVDKLESGELAPYGIIRKLFTSFGIDVMARESVTKLLEKQRKKEAAVAAGEPKPEKKKRSGGPGLAGQESMALIAVSELAGVSLGIVASLGVSLGLTAQTIMAKGTLAQKERWLPKLATFEHVGA